MGKHLILFLIVISIGMEKSYAGNDTLKTVASVDVTKYAGKWYEIASKPIYWQRNCQCTTAEYTLNKDGLINVYNSCEDVKREKRVDAKGKAKPVQGSNNSRLKVKFFGLFTGDYQIIALADDYSYAMVGTGDRKYLWILSRTKLLDESVIKKLFAEAESQGFNTKDIGFTKQTCAYNY